MAITKVSPDLLDLDAGITISVADNSDNLTLTSTDTDANSGPNFRMYRNSGTDAADGDAIGLIDFEGRNDNSQDVVYAAIDTRIVDVSNGSEDGRIEIGTILGGTAGVSRVLMDATETVFNDNSKDLDFRVESDNDANAFFLQGNTGNIALGHNAPDSIFHIKDSADTYLTLEAGSSDGNVGLIFHDNGGSQNGYTLYDTDDDIFYINVNSINRVTIRSGNHFEFRGPDANSNQFKMMDSSGNIDGYLYAEAEEIGFLDADGNWAMQVKKDNYVRFLVNNSEGGRFDSSGNFLIGKTSTAVDSSNGVHIKSDGTIFSNISSSTTGYQLRHDYNNRFFVTHLGVINAQSTSISAISDERLKENIKDLETGLTEVLALKPRRFDWVEDEKVPTKNIAGFIAQEVETVLPDLIGSYEHDRIEDAKSLRMGDMIPTLVKAIQEQQEQIEQLKTEIQTLKGE